MLKINGEYEITINIYNMFHHYVFITRNHNVVTNEGVALLLNCAINNNSDVYFGRVWVGTNSNDATYDDTVSTFHEAVMLESEDPIVDNNTLTYNISTDGGKLNNTTEIGIWSDDEHILITRDVHDRYDMPPQAQITLKYVLTLKNMKNEELEEEEIIND